MRPSNLPRNVASFKNAESVATTPQLRAAACDGALSASAARNQCFNLKMFGLRRWRLPTGARGPSDQLSSASPVIQRALERGLPRRSNVAGPLSWHRTPPISCARFASLNQQYSKLQQYSAISGELPILLVARPIDSTASATGSYSGQ